MGIESIDNLRRFIQFLLKRNEERQKSPVGIEGGYCSKLDSNGKWARFGCGHGSDMPCNFHSINNYILWLNTKEAWSDPNDYCI